MNWQVVMEDSGWCPTINKVEIATGIPCRLLGRMAYQESRFRPELIRGIEASPKGALGILQLMPQFWPSVRVPVPFQDHDVCNQILEAGKFVKSLHVRFGSWEEALAAYNFGPGNEKKYLEHKIAGLPRETSDYVREILSDVPVGGEVA
jgi:soluble lytic murein transglycosylase-like protein